MSRSGTLSSEQLHGCRDAQYTAAAFPDAELYHCVHILYMCAHVFHTLSLVSSLTQVCSRCYFLWCWLKTRKISPTGAKSCDEPDHYCLKVTARSKKYAISSKYITACACNSSTNIPAATYFSPQRDEKAYMQQL